MGYRSVDTRRKDEGEEAINTACEGSKETRERERKGNVFCEEVWRLTTTREKKGLVGEKKALRRGFKGTEQKKRNRAEGRFSGVLDANSLVISNRHHFASDLVFVDRERHTPFDLPLHARKRSRLNEGVLMVVVLVVVTSDLGRRHGAGTVARCDRRTSRRQRRRRGWQRVRRRGEIVVVVDFVAICRASCVSTTRRRGRCEGRGVVRRHGSVRFDGDGRGRGRILIVRSPPRRPLVRALLVAPKLVTVAPTRRLAGFL